jgi:hypothetical protein
MMRCDAIVVVVAVGKNAAGEQREPEEETTTARERWEAMGIDGRLGCARDVYVHTIITSTRKLLNVRRGNGLSSNDVCPVYTTSVQYMADPRASSVVICRNAFTSPGIHIHIHIHTYLGIQYSPGVHTVHTSHPIHNGCLMFSKSLNPVGSDMPSPIATVMQSDETWSETSHPHDGNPRSRLT